MVKHMKTNSMGVCLSRRLVSRGMHGLVLGCAMASLFLLDGVESRAQSTNGIQQSQPTPKGQVYRGVVVDDEDLPLLGVSVKDSHGKTITLTDQTGEFRTMSKDQDLPFTPTLLKNAVHVVLHREALRFHATIYPKRTRNAILRTCNLTTKPYDT